VQVRWSLLDIDGTVVQEQLLGTTLAADTLRATAQFSLETLRPGLYTIRATVLSDGSLLGTASTTIRKSGGS